MPTQFECSTKVASLKRARTTSCSDSAESTRPFMSGSCWKKSWRKPEFVHTQRNEAYGNRSETTIPNNGNFVVRSTRKRRNVLRVPDAGSTAGCHRASNTGQFTADRSVHGDRHVS